LGTTRRCGVPKQQPNVCWIEEVRSREPRIDRELDIACLLAEVRDEFDA
jgi:hypothetical protein